MDDELHGEGPCARCGRNPAAGFASIGDDWYCHDERPAPNRGTCYEEANWQLTADRLRAKLNDPDYDWQLRRR